MAGHAHMKSELDTLRATTTVQNEELRQRAARAEEARERLAAELQSQNLAITEHKVRWEGAEKAPPGAWRRPSWWPRTGAMATSCGCWRTRA